MRPFVVCISYLAVNKKYSRSVIQSRDTYCQNIVSLFLLLLYGLCAINTAFAVDFSAVKTYDTGDYPYSVISGDFNGDNRPDLAIANFNSDTVSIFVNNGDGSFAAKVDYPTGSHPISVTSGDFDGVNGLDLAVSSNTVSIFLNNGDGTFAAKVDYPTGSGPNTVTGGDFDGVNGPDLAIANSVSNTVSILINNGDGTFAAKVDYPTGSGPGSVFSGDFDAGAIGGEQVPQEAAVPSARQFRRLAVHKVRSP